jgi:hypothetical protein
MRTLFAGTIAGTTAAALAAALALAGCERGNRTERGAVPLAQVDNSDAGYGMPNPMPGSPIADGGITPITPPPPSAAPSTPFPQTPSPSPSH